MLLSDLAGAISKDNAVARALIKALVAFPKVTSADLAVIAPLVGPDFYFDLVLNHRLVDCAVLCALVTRCDSERRARAVFSRAQSQSVSHNVAYFSLTNPRTSVFVKDLALREIASIVPFQAGPVNPAVFIPAASTLEMYEILEADVDQFCGRAIGQFLCSMSSATERELFASARWSIDDMELLAFAEHQAVTSATYGNFVIYARSECMVPLLCNRARTKGWDPKTVLVAGLGSRNPKVKKVCLRIIAGFSPRPA